MKKLSTILLLLCTAISFAQLRVKPTSTGSDDTYLYVKGTVLYVTDDINLTENNDTDIASIYLRNEGQLVQGRTDASQNKGNGIISVYQEGTSDAYAYNYWGSPVGVNSSSTGNTPFGITLLGAPNSTLKSNPANMVSGYNGSSANGGVLNIAHYWIYKYIGTGTANYFSWQQVKSNQSINAGEGFTMKGVNGTDNLTVNGVQNNPGSGQRYDFRGRPNDGTIQLVTPTNYGEIILVGNPYPSALDLNYFLLENSGSGTVPSQCTGGATVARRNATTGIAYFWDSDPAVQSHNIADYKGGYATYSPNGDCSSNGIFTPPTFYNYNGSGQPVNGSGVVQSLDETQHRRFSPIGQGFFVDVPSSGTLQPVQFRNAHRRYIQEDIDNESMFHRSASVETEDNSSSSNNENVVPKIRLNISFSEQYTRQLALAFSPDATPAIDYARDAVNFDGLASDAGFLHNASSYVIDVRPFEENDRIPLYLNLSQQKDIAFKVNNLENFDVANIYIYDKNTEVYHPIKNNYFYINLPAGNHSERFEITFKDSEDELDLAKTIADSFTVYQDNTASLLQVLNPQGVDLKSVAVFDMTGKQILSSYKLGAENNYSFSTQNLADAVYIVRITTKDNIVTTKKITVFNRR